MKSNVTVFNGSAYRVKKINALRDEVTAFPEGSIMLTSDVVLDPEDSTVPIAVEVWVAVPVTSSPAEVSSTVQPRQPEWDMTEDPVDDITVEVEDV